ncbi:uronyl 2-sulfotransferase-like [Amphiura filiformis]|uniref:uronyl 2-sulfotransferase-like n=1 Tax=Amphiura filiformis TaxID=82378 RepID=UPI003B225AF4
MNSIETLWAEVSYRIGYMDNQPITLQELRHALIACWRDIPQGTLTNLVQGTSRRTFDECVLQELNECVSPVKLSTQISFFCGAHPGCSEPSEWSLQQAKKHIEEEYLFVGINEDFESSVPILERLAPDLFHGIVAEFMNPPTDDNITRSSATHKGQLPSKKVRAIMMTKLDLEYQLYNFVKNKLERLNNTLGITKQS